MTATEEKVVRFCEARAAQKAARRAYWGSSGTLPCLKQRGYIDERGEYVEATPRCYRARVHVEEDGVSHSGPLPVAQWCENCQARHGLRNHYHAAARAAGAALRELLRVGRRLAEAER